MPWFEDIAIGTRWSGGPHRFTEEEIIAFARQYDPQPFHVDPAAAQASAFGGLVASGWHTCAIWMRFFIRQQQARPLSPGEPATGPSPGIVDLRWPAPVRPDDEIAFSGTVIEKRHLRTRPAWGIIRQRAEGINQNGETVLSFIAQGLARTRNEGAAT